MKELWMVSEQTNATYQAARFKLGWWNEETRSWVLVNGFARSLVEIITNLRLGDPTKGDIPDLTITTREQK